MEPFKVSFFSITGWGTDLDYCDTEWFALEINRDHSVIFETAPKYCILDYFVDYEGHSISSKRLLPTVVDIRAVTPQETDPVLPGSIQESPVEAWVGSGLLQGRGR